MAIAFRYMSNANELYEAISILERSNQVIAVGCILQHRASRSYSNLQRKYRITKKKKKNQLALIFRPGNVAIYDPVLLDWKIRISCNIHVQARRVVS